MPGGTARVANRASAALVVQPHGTKVVRIAELAVEVFGDLDDCPVYVRAMAEAVERHPPPFDSEGYERLYRDAALDARWMATSLLTNSEREGDGSRRLWSLAAFSEDDDERQQLKRHAVDESKHSLMYLGLLDLAFPDAVSPEFRIELRQLSPGFSMRAKPYLVPGSPYGRKPTIDDFIQMNIAEIRTTLHHMMQRAALTGHAPAENMSTIKHIQDCLLRDELAHVGYTARLIERLAGPLHLEQVIALVGQRLHDFNQITREELGANAFDCSVACCAKREWCRARSGAASPAFHDA